MSFLVPLIPFMGASTAAAAPAFGGAVGGSILAGTVTGAAAPTVGAGIGLGTAAAAGSGLSLGSMLGLGAAGLSLVGNVMQGQNQSDYANANADILDYNAKVERENAKAAMYAGEADKAKLARQKKIAVGQYLARQGASGFSMAGTPLSMLADMVSQYELDEETTMWNARTKAGQYRSQADIYNYSANAQRSKAKNALGGGLLSGLVSSGAILGTSMLRG